MISASNLKCPLVWLAASIIVFATAVPASATIDTFTIDHISGNCSNAYFHSGHFLWADRARIQIASGEKIRVTLYGHGANFAQDADGWSIHEWISGSGTTTDYPGAPIMFGGYVPKGYVAIEVKAIPSDGLGNRTVTVKWLTGNERFHLKIVDPDCDTLSHATYRTPMAPGGRGTGRFFTIPKFTIGSAPPPPTPTPTVMPRP